MIIKLKDLILQNICYTDLVYGRIRKKLNQNLTNREIEEYILRLIQEIPPGDIIIRGKNYYLSNFKEQVRLTINRNTFRIITADKMDF